MLERFLLLNCLSVIAMNAAILDVRIEDEHGTTTPARVYLVDGTGQPYHPEGVIRYDKVRADGIAEHHFVPPRGEFAVELPAGKYRLTVERGKEYVPAQVEIAVGPNDRVTQRVRLKRWADMAARRWFSGDMHLHRGLTDLRTLMEAEDLNAAIPITQWKTTGNPMEDPDLRSFLSQSDHDGSIQISDKRFFTVLNQELESRASALLASSLGKSGATLAYPLASYAKAVHEAGGLADSEKATSLELPALAAVGAVDMVGLVNNHLWRSGSFHEPWGAWPDRMLGHYEKTCVGYVRAGFDMYSALLNSGLSVKLSAGTASGVHPVPPGWSRVYVHVGSPMTARSWFSALREGRSFITTGPMLLLRVNGKEPGDEFMTSSFPLKLDVAVEVLSLEPVQSVEVVVNGVVHPLTLKPDRAKENRYRGSMTLAAQTAAWVTARWVQSRGNSCDAAHTSPVYVRSADRKIPLSRKNAEGLLGRVEQIIRNLDADAESKRILIDSDATRGATIDYLEKARGFYMNKLAETSALRDRNTN